MYASSKTQLHLLFVFFFFFGCCCCPLTQHNSFFRNHIYWFSFWWVGAFEQLWLCWCDVPQRVWKRNAEEGSQRTSGERMSKQDNTLQTLQNRDKVEWIRGLSCLQWQDKGAWPLIFLELDWGLLSLSTDREVAF